MNEREASTRGIPDHRFFVDWRKLGGWLTEKACAVANISSGTYSFDGVIIYASHDNNTGEGRKFYKWISTWLDRQPGVKVSCLERQPKAPPKCPTCYQVIEYCPHTTCGVKMSATVEKGVDTLIATDMIRLAWEDAYDIAVLASLDRDLVPAVEFLTLKGRRIIQAGFPPSGIALAKACWASFDVFPDRAEICRL